MPVRYRLAITYPCDPVRECDDPSRGARGNQGVISPLLLRMSQSG